MGEDSKLQKAEGVTDRLAEKLKASPRTFIYVVLAASLAFGLGWCAKPARADGYKPREGEPPFQSSPVSASAAVAASAATGGTASASAVGGSQSVKAYGVGGTGLTSTASHQGSVSVLFGLVATTYTDAGAVHRAYAEQLCPKSKDENACFFRMACLDPDYGEQAKAFIGCKQ